MESLSPQKMAAGWERVKMDGASERKAFGQSFSEPMSLSSLQALVGGRARRVTLRGCIPRFIHEQQRVERFGRLLLIRRISGLFHACSDDCIGLVQNWPKHNILRFGIRRSFNLHIVSKAAHSHRRSSLRHLLPDPGYSKDRVIRLDKDNMVMHRFYIPLRRISKLHRPHGLQFDSFHAHQQRRVTSRLLYVPRRAHAKASVNNNTAIVPRSSPTYPCEAALRISTLHP
jgi:hypothetical protein